MNARMEIERRKTMRICERAYYLFPAWSHSMRQKWIKAKFNLALVEPKVDIGCRAKERSTWKSAVTV